MIDVAITTIFRWINEVLFGSLQSIVTFNKNHITMLLWLFGTGIALLFIFRFLARSNRARKSFLKALFYIAAIAQFVLTFYVDIYSMNYGQNGNSFATFNWANFFYSINPLNLQILSLIFLGIAIYKKKNSFFCSFLLFVSMFLGLNNLLFIEKSWIDGFYIFHIVVNAVLFFAPVYMLVFKIFKPDTRGLVNSLSVLLCVLILSYGLTELFSLGYYPNKYKYNYNYTMFPWAWASGSTINKVLKAFYDIIPVRFVYLILPLLILSAADFLLLFLLKLKDTKGFASEFRALGKAPVTIFLPFIEKKGLDTVLILPGDQSEPDADNYVPHDQAGVPEVNSIVAEGVTVSAAGAEKTAAASKKRNASKRKPPTDKSSE